MSIKPLYIYVLLLGLTTLGIVLSNDVSSPATLVTTQSDYTAGEPIQLTFEGSDIEPSLLYCSNSYGSIMITPQLSEKKLIYHIPDSISKKSGQLYWQLLDPTNPQTGSLTIHPQSTISSLESYLGPPSIEAGGTDYTMLVVIPTDALDNPLKDETEVLIKHQFLSIEESTPVATDYSIAFKNLFSYQQSGRMIISSESLGLNSKEFDVNVMPAIPENFNINASRVHDYADGNQITTLKSSVIKDRFNNVVSDGTFVTFFITNKEGHKTKTSGATINGIATARVLHPDYADDWEVKAYVEGMANSDSIQLSYKQAIKDYEVSFSEDKRTISIGPIRSFMEQRVPDGLAIKLRVYKNDSLDNEILERSYKGFASFKLNEDRYPPGTYQFEIEASRIIKSFKNIIYE